MPPIPLHRQLRANRPNHTFLCPLAFAPILSLSAWRKNFKNSIAISLIGNEGQWVQRVYCFMGNLVEGMYISYLEPSLLHLPLRLAGCPYLYLTIPQLHDQRNFV